MIVQLNWPITFNRHHSFLNEFIKCIAEHKPLSINNYIIHNLYEDGSRKSGKSVNTGAIFLAKALNVVDKDLNYVPCSAIVLRKDANKIDGVYREYTKWIKKATNDEVKCYSTRKVAIFPNDNYIQFVGWVKERNGEGEIAGSGLPSLSGEYIFIIMEEAFGFTVEETQHIEDAVRADNKQAHVLTIKLCNPRFPHNPHIQFISKHLPYNKRILATKGYQWTFKKIDELKEAGIPNNDYEPENFLIIHNNWRTNKENLTKKDINGLLRSYITNKAEAPMIDLGVPGYSSSSCYGTDLNNITQAIYYRKDFILAGGDVGVGTKSNGKTSFVFAGAGKNGALDIYNCYEYDPARAYKPLTQLVSEIITFYVNCKNTYEAKTGARIDLITCRVDKNEITFIGALNKEAERRGIDWLQFIQCGKFPIQDRVKIFNILLGLKLFRIDFNNCVYLRNELDKAVWDDRVCINPQRKDKDDHMINALEYAIEPIMLLVIRLLTPQEISVLGLRRNYGQYSYML